MSQIYINNPVDKRDDNYEETRNLPWISFPALRQLPKRLLRREKQIHWNLAQSRRKYIDDI